MHAGGTIRIWTRKIMADGLPTDSIVVIDNAPSHNTQTDHAPTSISKKKWNDCMVKVKKYSFYNSL